jgi:NADH pyrophosphatase NudC (nudix superfamily)
MKNSAEQPIKIQQEEIKDAVWVDVKAAREKLAYKHLPELLDKAVREYKS